jgi:hypothetical protein
MKQIYEHSSFSMSSSLKNETDDTHEHSSFSVSSSLKNETDPPPIELSLPLDLIPKPSFHPPVSVDPLSSSLSGEPIPISIQESNQGVEEESMDETKLGGHVSSLWTSCWS